MAIAIMLSITVIWLAVGYWGCMLAGNPDFNKTNIPMLLAIFVFPFIFLFAGAILGII